MTDERRRSATLFLCCLAQFMVILDVSIVNVALPSIQSDLGFEPAHLQWVVNAYTLTFAGFLLLGGRAADLIGRRTVFIAGLGVFGAASLAGGLAQSDTMLVLARAVQGLGGAIVAPATLSILTTAFAEGPERNRALGLWAAMGGAGGAAGALLGGILTETLSWRWILIINVPIGIGAAVAAMRFLLAEQDSRRGAKRGFDLAGAITVTAGLVVLTYGIVGSEQAGWVSLQTLGLIGVGAVLLAVFTFIEGRLAQTPLVPLRIFASRALTGANIVILFMGSAAFAMWYFVSLYLQEVLGFSPIEAGLAFLPMTLAVVASSQLASRWVSRFGPGPVLVGGMSSIAVGMLLFSGVSADGSWAGDVLVPSLFASAGIGFSFVPVTIAATAGVSGPEQGLASGLVNTSRQVGGSLGLALLATIATQRTADLTGSLSRGAALTQGFDRAFLVGGLFAVAGALAAAVLLLRRPVQADVAVVPG